MTEENAEAMTDLKAENKAYWTVLELIFERFPECQCIGDLPGWIDELKAKVNHENLAD